MSTTSTTGLRVERQAGALGAIVTGVDLADGCRRRDVRPAARRAARAPRDLHPRPGAHHPRPADRVLGALGPASNHTRTYRRSRDTPRSSRSTTRTRHRHVARRLHVREAAARRQPPPRPDHPARRRRHHVLQRLPGVRATSPPGCARRSTGSAPSHYATQMAIDKGMPEDEIVNAHPVGAHPSRDGPPGAVRERQLHAPLRELERSRQRAVARVPLPAVREVRVHVAAPVADGRPR